MRSREEILAYKRAWGLANRDRLRLLAIKNDRMRRYGLTLEAIATIREEQHGACAICMRTDVKLCVDHDHADGRVRGLLCYRCNARLGWYEKQRARIDSYLYPADVWVGGTE